MMALFIFYFYLSDSSPFILASIINATCPGHQEQVSSRLFSASIYLRVKGQVLKLLILKLSEAIENIEIIMLKLTMGRHFQYVSYLLSMGGQAPVK